MKCSCSPKTYLKKKFKFKRPKKKKLIRELGWYLTRGVVGLLWCLVVWAFVGKDALPAYNKTEPCVVEHDLSNETLSNFFDSLMLNSDTDNSSGNDSYPVYACNHTDYKQCFEYQLDCSNQVPFTVQLLNNFNDYNEENLSARNYTLSFEVSEPTGGGKSLSYSLFEIPEGHFFALMVLIVAASIGGMVARFLKLPPLLGMMVAGFLLRNVPVIGIAGNISPAWSSTLRYTVLVIILIRGGMSLEAKQLWSLKLTLTALAFIPGILEAGVAGSIAIFFLGMPWQWGLMLGSILSAISPSVVVPTTLHLSDNVEGIHEGITTLVVAAANIDVVIAISLFSLFIGLIFSEGHILLDAFRGPIEIILGLVFGTLSGIMLWYLPTKHHSEISKTRNRFFLLLGFGLLAMFGSRQIVIQGASLGGAGPLGVLCVSFIGVQKWDKDEKQTVLRSFYILWLFCKPILFGLIGAALYIGDISASLVGKAVILLLACVGIRLFSAIVSVMGHNFNIREKVFVAIAWLPKATVQAAIGSVALDTALQVGTPEQIELGREVLTISVLAIVFTAPLGATLMGVLGPWLLENNEDDEEVSESEDECSSRGSSSECSSKAGSDVENAKEDKAAEIEVKVVEEEEGVEPEPDGGTIITDEVKTTEETEMTDVAKTTDDTRSNSNGDIRSLQHSPHHHRARRSGSHDHHDHNGHHHHDHHGHNHNNHHDHHGHHHHNHHGHHHHDHHNHHGHHGHHHYYHHGHGHHHGHYYGDGTIFLKETCV